ncbi:MAG: hypothetical protein V4850_06250 [Myxococcota bacterium]
MWWFPLVVGGFGCTPCELALAVDPYSNAWERSVEDVGARLETDGECPDVAPERVVMTNACAYAADPVTVDAMAAFVYASLWLEADPPERTLSVRFSPNGGAVACDVGADDASVFGEMGSDLLLADFRLDDDVAAAAPFFVTSASGVDLEITRAAPMEDFWVDPERASGVYGWVCLEAAPGPAEIERYAPAAWRGSAFVHGDDLDGAPVDLFLAFDSVACVGGEDASTRYGHTDGDPYFPGDCDGVDNDADGTVDEGAADRDEDGITDCLAERDTGEGSP